MTKTRILPPLRTLIAAASAVVGLLLVPAAGPAAALTSQTGVGTPVVRLEPATVEVKPTITLSGSLDVLAPGGEITFTSTITNTTAETLPAGRATLSSSDRPLSTRKILDGWLSGASDLRLPGALDSVSVPELAPGASYGVPPVTLTADQLGLYSQYGNYPVRAYYRGGDVTAEDRSSILFDTGDIPAPVGVALVVPITVPTSGDGLIPSESLAQWTAPGGVLTRQLDESTGRAVTLAIDPMILASIRVLGSAAPESARAWLQRLQDSPNESFLLQYGDADGSLQAQSGLPVLNAPASLLYGVAAENFAETAPTAQSEPSPEPTTAEEPRLPTLGELTAWPASISGLLWPTANTTSAADLGVFAASGVSTTILETGQVASSELTTPGSLRTLGDRSVLVNDTALTRLLTEVASGQSPERSARASADLRRIFAAMARESGAESHRHLVALDRGWVDRVAGLDTALATLNELPESTVISLAAVLDQESSSGSLIPSVAPADRVTLGKQLTTDLESITRFADVLEQPEMLVGKEQAQLGSLFSVSWAGSPERWQEAVTIHNEATRTTLSSITLATTEQFNMVSWQSTLGFSVRNNLPYPARVTLRIESDNLRLSLDNELTKLIPASTTVKYSVPVRARIGNGQSVLALGLYGPTGVNLGADTSVPVNVRADWEIIGASVLIGLVVLLLGGGLTRTILKRRRARRSPETLPADPAESTSLNG
ncbi:DUF6049 family protein [Mycetocola spongiae]|uniref:DUF6049 family protein n=1 Tax=Mycetocola spongiae TaxID=2859226 RepID=UPI001CF46D15|nr:DUF6049 family protein [Mycetocola spongiae]UCR88255.1 hypothetical protein KXZ72_09710 [Mycetocola spongiae]